MEKITRANLLKQLDAVNEKITSLESKVYNYATNKAWPGCLVINKIENVKQLISTWETIHTATKTSHDAIAALGLDKLGLVNENDEKFNGFTLKEWEDDLKLCAQKFADAVTLKNLRKAKKILEKNMSEDDKFAADMNAVADLIK